MRRQGDSTDGPVVPAVVCAPEREGQSPVEPRDTAEENTGSGTNDLGL